MIKLIKRMLCKHKNLKFIRNIYGDEINLTGGRSWWVCTSCDRCKVKDSLYRP